MTDYVCKKCGKEKTHHDTAVPEVCEECSREHNICRRCGDRLEDHA
jgi:DNA-directed RNA polymerase subunit RPC12/RpoP